MNTYAKINLRTHKTQTHHRCLQCDSLVSLEQDFCCYGCQTAHKIFVKLSNVQQTDDKSWFKGLYNTLKNTLSNNLPVLKLPCIHCIMRLITPKNISVILGGVFMSFMVIQNIL